jgi:hypothetical protein
MAPGWWTSNSVGEQEGNTRLCCLLFLLFRLHQIDALLGRH